MRERFAQELASGHMADAYLLVGAARAHLRDNALACAAELLDAHHDVLQHADFTLFDPEEMGLKSGLKVEHIAYRKEGVPCLESSLRYRPSSGQYRAVVLLDADRMTEDAHGALLKTTEEPPDDTVLFFTATELFALSPALRSRCRIWRVPRQPAAHLERQAAAAGIETDAWHRLLGACGSGEAALELRPDDRQFLLDSWVRVEPWLGGQAGLEGWCHLPEASNLAEQRRLGLLLLTAIRAWILAPGLEANDELLLFQSRWCRRIDEALARLSGQVTPALVFQDLAQIP
ncbi:MAG: hypothetical protein QF489_10000 [Planctomycetota bacterium]|jgi:hypothetical protein|nr:hypothetical protein [Planctomycetota bacterium]